MASNQKKPSFSNSVLWALMVLLPVTILDTIACGAVDGIMNQITNQANKYDTQPGFFSILFILGYADYHFAKIRAQTVPQQQTEEK